jgi:hypothetical protein
MAEDGPGGIAEIFRTPCIFRKEEKAMIAAAVMTAGNHPALEPYHKFSLTNQRSPAEQGPGPFEEPSSYPRFFWWSLIFSIRF